jgi:hypothetical protein
MPTTPFEKFIRLINNNSDYDTIYTYVRKIPIKLSKYLDQDDPYSSILNAFFSNTLSDFSKINLPWKLIQNYNFRETDKLTVSDLEDARILGLVNHSMYFSILYTFLKNHDIDDIPESFIKHYDLLDNRNFIDDICRFIKRDKLEDGSQLKYINLLIFFLERFDITISNESHENYKEKLDIYYILERYFELNDDDNPEYMYHEEIITEDNIIGFYLISIKNRDLRFENHEVYYFMTELSNYFEYMKMDEQIEYWNILIEYYNDNDMIEILCTSTESDVFINYVFDNYDKLKSENGVYEIISNGKLYQYAFYQNLLSRYPQTRNTLIINLMIVSFDFCMLNFPDLTNQELHQILKNKFL